MIFCLYFSIYIWGSIFVMVGLGMNTFINAQGFAKKGMLTILIGAIINIILDPIFIFGLDLGIKGAAIATVIAQFISASWVLHFLFSDKAIYRIKKSCMKLDFKLIKEIVSLGFSGFVFATTGSLVQIVCNNVLLFWGGNIYVGIMTVLNSIRDVLQMTIEGIRSGAQPVISYNYGAGQYLRVRQGIKFLTKIALLYTSIAWCILDFFPEFFIHLFNSEEEMLLLGVPALHIYFLGFFMMAFQSAGQTTFISLGMGKYATFFSLFRKVILVIPLTIFLPNLWDLGVYGVFYAEMISNFVGGIACFSTMMMVVWRRLGKLNK
jgi:Na+-driven multidrug efflux pump